ncbi:beta-like 3, isoform CRA_b [Blyttiomyces helicus]|uniref:Beta-like 3, isoform CRA_b n=1 Tax=Blyttiomyces helicus TaxID=388810 RepID=A0A4P9WDJ1_9FUNG|nr:beta-like 3, isoform CRA_b [Blyttiomyces helicus]|eukprot:RKO89298.1 beta-like 3, isoform CRA_b [Blyttiomyces helicus]
MEFDPTSTLVATGSADSTIKVWDVDRGHATHNFKGHSGIISVVRFHPDRRRLRLVSGSDDCKVRVWDLESRSCVAVLDSHVSVVRSLDFSVDGRHLVTGGRDKVLSMWNMETFELEKTLPIFESIEASGVIAASSPAPAGVAKKGSVIAYSGGEKGIIRIWDLLSGKCLMEQEPETNSNHEIVGIIYLKKSHSLVALTSDQNILFYNLADGLKRTRQIAGYNEEVLDLTLLGQEESHLAVVTNTDQLRVYNLETNDCDILYGHTEIVMCVDRSKTGTTFVSGAKDRKAIVWKFDAEAEPESRGNGLGVTG